MKNKLNTLLTQHYNRLGIAGFSAAQVFINFAISLLIVRHLGFGHELDVFYIALAIYTFLTTAIGWNLNAVLTPLYVTAEPKIITGKMFLNTTLIATVIGLIALAASFFWLPLIFANYWQEMSPHTIQHLQFILLATFWVEVSSTALLAQFHAHNRYLFIAILSTLASVTALIFTSLTLPTYGVIAAGYAQLLHKSLIAGVFIYFLRKPLFNTLTYSKKSMQELFTRSKYLIAGSLYYRTDELSERVILSFLSTGTLSLLAFIGRLYGAIITVLNAAISVPTITTFSKLIQNQQHQHIIPTLNTYLIALSAINLTLFAGIALVGKPLLLYFFPNQIPPTLTYLLLPALLCLAATLFGKTLGQVTHNALLALKLEKAITKIDASIFTLTLALKILGVIFYGVYGLFFAIILQQLLTNILKYKAVLRYV